MYLPRFRQVGGGGLPYKYMFGFETDPVNPKNTICVCPNVKTVEGAYLMRSPVSSRLIGAVFASVFKYSSICFKLRVFRINL